MPRGDRTGPAGMGARTGRTAGYCSGSSTPGFVNRILGGGFRNFLNRGGRGHRNMFNATGLPFWARSGMWNAENMPKNLTSENELEFLKNHRTVF